MTVRDQDSFREAQVKLDAKENLAPYMGKWVALRNGKVVASDFSAKALRDRDEVRPTNAIIPVPRTPLPHCLNLWSTRRVLLVRTSPDLTDSCDRIL